MIMATKAIATPPGQPTRYVEMTPAEVADIEKQRKAFAAAQKARQDAAVAANADRLAARGRLMASGLTAQQIDDLIKLMK